MTLETCRLLLQALTPNQLLNFIRDDGSLEAELKLKPGEKVLSKNFRMALSESILPAVSIRDEDYIFNTLWIIILKTVPEIIGEFSFSGAPDGYGEIEIGYGTYEAYRGNGFMTEAVAGIIAWAKTQPGIKSITASTANVNIASYSILEHNHFIKIGEGEDMLVWKLQLK